MRVKPKIINTITIIVGIFISFPILAKPSLPASITLSEKEGSYFIPKGKPFQMGAYLKQNAGRVIVAYYVDPDERGSSQPLEGMLKAVDISPQKLQHLIFINLKAAKLPGWLIKSLLKKRVKNEIGRSTYILDKKKILTKPPYSLPDHSYFLAVLSKSHKILYTHTGKMTDQEAQKALSIIQGEVDKK